MLKKQSRGSSAVVTEEATPTPSKPHPKPTDQQQPQIHYKRGQRVILMMSCDIILCNMFLG